MSDFISEAAELEFAFGEAMNDLANYSHGSDEPPLVRIANLKVKSKHVLEIVECLEAIILAEIREVGEEAVVGKEAIQKLKEVVESK